ncbi:MAG: phosphoribosyltransferase [Halothece sp.]
MLFRDRFDAGEQLARKLKAYANRSNVLVLALPRGGVPVAYQVAKTLNAPLDVLLVRKLGVPGREELAMGAIASGGVRVLNEELIQTLNISEADIQEVAAKEQQELKRREKAYRGNLPPLDVSDRTVILVDDGLATGATMRVAAMALREEQCREIIGAVPVSAPEICNIYTMDVDQMICAETPQPFYAVGLWYENFSQTTDEEVRELLNRAASQQPIPS